MFDVERLVPLFGSNKEIARVAQCDKSLVIRWRHGTVKPQPRHQERLWRAAGERGLPLEEVAQCLSLPHCPVCGTYHLPPF